MVLTTLNLWSSNWRRQLKLVWLQDKIILALFGAALFFNLALYLAIFLGIRASAESFILHYSVYFGIDLIGARQQLYFMPAVGTFLGLVNFLLAFYFYKKEKISSYFLGGGAVLINFLLLISGVLLIWVNQ